MTSTTDANRELIRGFWDDLYRKDFDACGAYFADDGVYTDVPVGEQGATGPAEVAARLRLGLEPITGYVHILRNLAADGDVVLALSASGETEELLRILPAIARFQVQIAGPIRLSQVHQ
jgi:limonene-1,2-epoxide hydrolase